MNSCGRKRPVRYIETPSGDGRVISVNSEGKVVRVRYYDKFGKEVKGLSQGRFRWWTAIIDKIKELFHGFAERL